MKSLPFQKALANCVVLVVDDEPDSIMVASTLLRMAGAKVLTAANGRDGFEIAHNERPTFIISDLSMPEMSGWEMLLRVRENLPTSQTPVIALSAHAMDGDRNRALAAGFHNYLTKPLQPESFINELLRILMDIPELSHILQINKESA
jgi:CheY-like chemotaxis protein